MPKITETPVATTMAANDIFVIVKNPQTVAQTAHVSLAAIVGNLSANIVMSGNTLINTPTLQATNVVISFATTPSGSSDTVVRGKFWFDTNYAYFAVANNVIKRVALQSF